MLFSPRASRPLSTSLFLLLTLIFIVSLIFSSLTSMRASKYFMFLKSSFARLNLFEKTKDQPLSTSSNIKDYSVQVYGRPVLFVASVKENAIIFEIVIVLSYQRFLPHPASSSFLRLQGNRSLKLQYKILTSLLGRICHKKQDPSHFGGVSESDHYQIFG